MPLNATPAAATERSVMIIFFMSALMEQKTGGAARVPSRWFFYYLNPVKTDIILIGGAPHPHAGQMRGRIPCTENESVGRSSAVSARPAMIFDCMLLWVNA